MAAAALAYDYYLTGPRMAHAGELIAKRRKELGLIQEELGELLNVGQTTISYWERTGAIPASRLEQIASILQMDPELLRAATTNETREATPAPRLVAGVFAIGREAQSEWSAQVTRDGGLTLLSRVVLSQFPSYIERRETSAEAFVTRRDVLADFPDVTTANIDDVWSEILNSGYLEPVSDSQRVFRLRFPASD